MISPEDRAVFEKAEPYITGIVALVMYVAIGHPSDPAPAFGRAELFMKEFKKRLE